MMGREFLQDRVVIRLEVIGQVTLDAVGVQKAATLKQDMVSHLISFPDHKHPKEAQ